MSRIHRILLATALVGLAWQGMTAVHELGHVVGATLTGGTVRRVVLHPLTISRTDVSPNPRPGVVVWAGPVLGCLAPLAVWAVIPHRWETAHAVAQFFAGFCLIANGAYIAFGSFGGVGDCGEMLRCGAPQWLLIAFGVAALPTGFWLWHGLGSPLEYLRGPAVFPAAVVYAALALWSAALALAFTCSLH